MKKIVSIMLTLVLILSSSVSAFAENTATITSGEENSNSASHKVTASYISSEEDDPEGEQGSSEEVQSGAAVVSETESEAEAKWGSSAENFSFYGTWEEALVAAKNDEANVKYIQLLKDITLTDNDTNSKMMIEGGKFTFDLNGKTVSSAAIEPVINVVSGEVTFTDTSVNKGGSIESTCNESEDTVRILDGKAVFEGGSYKGVNALNVMGGKVSISGGTFDGQQNGIVCDTSGIVTISGGAVSCESAACIFTCGNTTVTGGNFTREYEGNIIYYVSGTLDLSGYKDINAESKFHIFCGSDSSNIWVNADSMDTIKLPAGYCLSKDGSTVSDKLSKASYEVIPESETYEAKWGASENELPYRGTLEAALALVNKAEGVNYIQLQTDVNGRYSIPALSDGRNLVFDLNGKTLRGKEKKGDDEDSDAVITIAGGNVTFKDSGLGGRVISGMESHVISVLYGKAVFTGGTYEGNVSLHIGVVGEADIQGGTFKGTSSSESSIMNSGTLTISSGTINADGNCIGMLVSCVKTTISGGSFSSGANRQHIMYGVGELDLSSYQSCITDLTIFINMIEGTDASKIKLPKGYGLSGNGTTLYSKATLDYGSYYIIASSGESGGEAGGDTDPEAKWGTSADNLTGSGTLSEAFDAAGDDANIKFIQLQKDKTLTNGVRNLTLGKYTLDLNGKTINGKLMIAGADVTFADSSSDKMGKVIRNTSGESAIHVLEGKAAFTGGTYEGSIALDVDLTSTSVTISNGVFKGIDDTEYVISNSGSMTISGGTISGGNYCLRVMGDTVITGGTFIEAKKASILHGQGSLDLSKHTGSMSDYTIENWRGSMTVTNVSGNVVYSSETEDDGDICLPGGYGLADADLPNTVVSELIYGEIYKIVSGRIITPAPTAKAEITGVTICVGGTTYEMGNGSHNIVLTKDSSAVEIKVQGNHFDKLSSSNILYYADRRSSEVGSSTGWNVDAENGTATKNFATDRFVNCSSAYEVVYSNDGGSTKCRTGIYMLYQSNVESVKIGWGTLDFTYSDEQVDGADKGWTYEPGENEVEVTNCAEDKKTLNVTVSYTPAEGYSGIEGKFGGESSDTLKIQYNNYNVFKLELSGKPEGTLSNAVIGTVTVTIKGGE